MVVQTTSLIAVAFVAACSNVDSRAPPENGDCVPHDGVPCAPHLSAVAGSAGSGGAAAGGGTSGNADGGGTNELGEAGTTGGSASVDAAFDFGAGGGDNSPGGAGVPGSAPQSPLADASLNGGFAR